MSFSKITYDNYKIFGITKNLTAKMINIETAQTMNNFFIENMIHFPVVNSVAINFDNNILLFNGNLFCTRSGKLIYSFLKLTQHLSGVFIHSDSKILINCKLFDLRAAKFLDRIQDLENFIIKKSYNDDITRNIEDHFYKWRHYFGSYENKVLLYDIKTFSSRSTSIISIVY
ncbi:hypothetical protein MXB_3595 [Myxobolus squamalis]|nr:hypothetical protein MXB_3595 [Myxobolus squamalis]